MIWQIIAGAWSVDQVEIERAGACVAIKLAASGCARRASEPEPATGSRCGVWIRAAATEQKT